jgi:thymidine phosphorylase
VEAQGGDPRVCDEPDSVLPLARETLKVESARAGYISAIATDEIGHAIAAIGGGRVRIEDGVDPTVGFLANLRIGDQVSKGDLLGVVYNSNKEKDGEVVDRIRTAYEIGSSKVAPLSLIKEVINE